MSAFCIDSVGESCMNDLHISQGRYLVLLLFQDQPNNVINAVKVCTGKVYWKGSDKSKT